MGTLRSRIGLVAILVLASLPTSTTAQPVGSEFHVNTYTTGSQVTAGNGGHLVAADAIGNFVVIWTGEGRGDTAGIFGQRYDSSGVALGSELRVNSFTTGGQLVASVATAASGDFVVVWRSFNGIFGQRYDSGGGALGGEFRVNSYTTGNKGYPSNASDADGNFVVIWNSQGQDGSHIGQGIFGQRFDSAGNRLGGEFRVNSYTTGDQLKPSVASDASGNFVVVWTGRGQGDTKGIFGQRYDSAGAPQGAEFRVNSYTLSHQVSPSVASDASGNFVVVWNSYAQDGSYYGIFGQRFDSAGVVQGGEFRVNSFTTNQQRSPSVASDASGNFVVAWDSDDQDGSGEGVFGQRYDGAGVAQGGEFQINSFTTSFQTNPSVGATGTNQFVAVWSSFAQEGSHPDSGVFGQRFDFEDGASTIHVGDLDRKAKNVGATWRAQVKTLVHDDNHAPENGVLVTFNISGGVGMRTCTTVASGVCEVSVVVGDAVPSLTFTITNLSKVGFSYDAGANHDPDPDSDGTVIVVNQP